MVPERAPFAVAQSMCRAANFTPLDIYPIRSPLVVADLLLPHVRNKVYVEIGTQQGDLLKCLSYYAARVMAVERDPATCRRLRRRGIEVALCDDLRLETIERARAENRSIVPIADVYYWWLHPGDNKNMLSHLSHALERANKSASVFFGMDPHLDDMRHVASQLERLKRPGGYRRPGTGNVSRLFFDESDGEGYLQNPKLPREATYTTPFNGRPGRWGVFHVLSVGLGPGDPLV